MELPKEKIIRGNEIIDPKELVIYGQPKVGKTEILSQLENWLIIDLERGAENVDGLIVTANSLEELSEVGTAIIKAGKPYDGVIIDTITELEDWCEWDATEMYMNSSIGKKFNTKGGVLLPRSEWESVLGLPMGAGYLWLRLSYTKWVKKLRKLAPHLILCAHTKDKFLDMETDSNVSSNELDLTGKIKRMACKDADIGYLYRDPKNRNELRIAFTQEDNASSLSGSRSRHLRNQNFVLAVNNPDGSIKEHYWDKIFSHQKK